MIIREWKIMEWNVFKSKGKEWKKMEWNELSNLDWMF